MTAGWRFYIDRGGTFTDVVAQSPAGVLSTAKLLSHDPRFDDAALEGVRRELGLKAGAQIPHERVAEVRMGTTVATNALLERKGEKLVLVTTRGLKDQLRIGYQNRPQLFALRIDLPDMLYARVVEAEERVDAEGAVLRALDETRLAEDLRLARAEGFSSAAIVFMHGYRYPAHERRAAEIARAAGFSNVSTSHETMPLVKFVSRGDTTVADAYLSPALGRYVRSISQAVGAQEGGTRVYFMTSNGGLAAPAGFRGKDAILSGPAGGVVAMAETAREAGFEHVIGFDMGGTSTDVCRFDGSFERVYETEISGVRLRTPMMAIHTVAAGGGSILHDEGMRFRVGPDSAGADPGPLCYRRGGPLTITDANVMVGKIRSAHFPRLFGDRADEPIDTEGVHEAFEALARRHARGPVHIADGFIRIAVENMANAIRRISVARGYDVRRYALNCFGGAAGQHACLVADALGITRIFIHPFSGVLSAYGMKLACLRAIRVRAIGRALDGELAAQLGVVARELTQQADRDVRGQGGQNPRTTATVHLRYEGSDTTLPVPFGEADTMAAHFRSSHTRQFGFAYDDTRLLAESIEVEAVAAPERTDAASHAPAAPERPAGTARFYSQGEWHQAKIHEVSQIPSNGLVHGPALLIEPHQTIVVEPGWRAKITNARAVILSRRSMPKTADAGNEPDPILLEVFANLFMSIAEEMGAALQNTASSVNIKERLDFSCAVFDATGGLVANAPHMPVHLGSMGDCVAALISRWHGDMMDGDVFVTNAPYQGGTHLPDVTVVAPVFIDGAPQFFVAARGHHADIGGVSPGSMPPFSTHLDEEGALFDGLRMIRGGIFDEATMRSVLAEGDHPARNPDQNLADLRAQAAACAQGIDNLKRAAALYGADTIAMYMRLVQDNAEEAVRSVIGALKDGAFIAPMDGGIEIHVRIEVDHQRRSARIDFTGTSAQQNTNLNAPKSVTKAAVLYTFRCLVAHDIPMNAGCLKPLEIIIPEGSLLNPAHPAAVAGGNVETSQTVVDALFGALGVMAAAQGTMNNLTFGNDRYQYYETICGGSGAGADFDGQSAVHTHMTNSRLTDPEVLETRYPVVLEEFSIRHNSGGHGAHQGGCGVLRQILFREKMSVAILSTRRETEPFGLHGGTPGLPGANLVLRADGETIALKGRDEILATPGDRILIATPGGGGFGKP